MKLTTKFPLVKLYAQSSEVTYSYLELLMWDLNLPSLACECTVCTREGEKKGGGKCTKN